MLSFFAKKKHIIETPPTDAIQGPADAQQNSGDEFIFVEKKTPDVPLNPQPQPPQGMYPPIAPFGFPGGPSYPPRIASQDLQPVPYVQGVPFQLAPQLSTKSAFEVTQLQVDGIVAFMTRQMSLDEQNEYNFALERSVQNECF